MASGNEQDWGNYWQGRASHEALVGVGVENNEKLASFWQEQFAGIPKDTKILDMACGAGSVLKHAHGLGFTALTGADISKDAITTLKTTMPNVQGVVAPADKTGLKDAAYGFVTSQFGFEYAGGRKQLLAAAREMARLTSKNGRFTALCHIKGGGIEQEVSGHLQEIDKIERTNFIAAAKAVFKAAFAAEIMPSQSTKNTYDKAAENLAGPRNQLVSYISAKNSSGSIRSNDPMTRLATHLYNGTLEMFQKRRAYNLPDITGWLDGMSAQITAYKGRMQSMKTAALSEEMARAILAEFSVAGFDVQPLETLSLAANGKPAAWILRANRIITKP